MTTEQILHKLIADVREHTIAGHAALTSRSYGIIQANIYGVRKFQTIEKILIEVEKELLGEIRKE